MGRVAVVTGAASGMGEAIGRHLADRGHRIALLDLDGDAVQRIAGDLREGGAAALGGQVDVADRAAVDDALQKVRSELGPVEIMVTSAGIDAFVPFTEMTVDQWDRMLAVNLTGTFHCLQAAVPDMLAAGWGRIVTISSSSAQSGAARMAHYVASKGGVVGLTKALALELAPHGITVNSIPPGFIDTPMARRAEERGDLPSIARGRGAHAGPESGDARRHRGRVRVPLLGGSRLHHRPAHRCERRLVPVTPLSAPGAGQEAATCRSRSATASGSVIMRSCPVSMSQSRPSARAFSTSSGSRVAIVDVQTMWYWGISDDAASFVSSSGCSKHFHGCPVRRSSIHAMASGSVTP